MSLHLFGTENLSYEQLTQFVTELKKPGVVPPGGLVARDPVIVMKDNTGKYTNNSKNRVYLSKNMIGIQFADVKTSLNWGYRLMVKTGLPWERALYKFKSENMRIPYFHEIWQNNLNLSGLCGLSAQTMELDPQLVQFLKRKSREWSHMTTPYPDATPIVRAYHSLGKGDQLIGPDGQLWHVIESKPQLNGPPHVTVEPVGEADG